MSDINLKKEEIRKKILNQRLNIFYNRIDVVEQVELAKQIINEKLGVFSEKINGKNVNIPMIAEELGKERTILYGCPENQLQKFKFANPQLWNTETKLSLPTVTRFGILCSDFSENYTINLSSTIGSTQTVNGNTFSTYIGDYYLVRNREDNILVAIEDDVDPYASPNSDQEIGEDIPFGQDTTSVEGTWNETYNKINLSSITTKTTKIGKTSIYLRMIEIDGTLSKPPLIGYNYYLKRKNDVTEQITINSVVNSRTNLLEVSQEDFDSVGIGDTITSSFANNYKIIGKNDALLTLSFDKEFTNTIGAQTIGINHILINKNTNFAKIKIITEGLEENLNWNPIGDDNGDYVSTNNSENEAMVVSNSDFAQLLGFIQLKNAKYDDIVKSALKDIYISSSKEKGPGNYPDIVKNPMFPINNGTGGSYKKEGSVLTGTQPDSFDRNDLYCGHFTAWEEGRPGGEYRYLVSPVSKFFYLPNPLFTNRGSRFGSIEKLPSDTQPKAKADNTFVSNLAKLYNTLSSLSTGQTTVTDLGTVPSYCDAFGSLGDGDATVVRYTANASVKRIQQTTTDYSCVSSNSSYTLEVSSSTTDTSDGISFYNRLQTVFETSEFTFVFNVINAIANKVNNSKFGDTYVGLNGRKSKGGISDNSFKAAVNTLKTKMNNMYSTHNTYFSGPISTTLYNTSNFSAFFAEFKSFRNTVNKRIAEINTRIGLPTFETVSGAIPSYRVKKLPDTPKTGYVPYGRSIYNGANIALASQLELLLGPIEALNVEEVLITEIKKGRNQYEQLSDRNKPYAIED